MKPIKSTTMVIAAISVMGLAMIAMPTIVAAETYDLVILSGRVMDPETKLDAVRNVGIKDGKIVVITKDKIKGKESIIARGHVVAPGFIDMHDHNTATPFGQKLALRDGVTTPMELEAGVYPVDTWYAYLIAKFLQDNGVAQMAHKGRIQVGADADITVFDPKTVKDNSTMKDGGLPSTGIPYVVVNGTIVVEDSKVLKGVYPGKAIRRP